MSRLTNSLGSSSNNSTSKSVTGVGQLGEARHRATRTSQAHVRQYDMLTQGLKSRLGTEQPGLAGHADDDREKRDGSIDELRGMSS
jgi:hypothetical protein